MHVVFDVPFAVAVLVPQRTPPTLAAVKAVVLLIVTSAPPLQTPAFEMVMVAGVVMATGSPITMFAPPLPDLQKGFASVHESMGKMSKRPWFEMNVAKEAMMGELTLDHCPGRFQSLTCVPGSGSARFKASPILFLVTTFKQTEVTS